MKVTFLCQGLEGCAESVGSVLLDSLLDTKFNKFACLSAFVSLKGINGISDTIEKSKTHINQFNVVVGIDLNNTSKEALDALMKLNIGASIYYTSSPIVFHPKVYLFGGEKTRLIVGSSNITQKGLFQNVEASLKVDIVMPDPDGEELLKQANVYLNHFFNGTTVNLQKLTPELIQQLFESNIIPSEAEKKKKTKQERIAQKEKQDSAKMDAIKALFPTVPIQATPKGFKVEKPTVEEKTAIVEAKHLKIVLVPVKEPAMPMVPPSSTTATSLKDPWSVKGDLLWSKVLKPSDILQAKAGTNPTGGLRLTQAGYPIDQTTHFRNNIFGKLAWTVGRTKPAYVEVANVDCYVKILGKDKGLQTFTLRHKPSGEAHQNNYTTSLSWGNFGTEITKTDLSGKTFYLYKPQVGKDEPFYIEIGGQSTASSASNMAKWFG